MCAFVGNFLRTQRKLKTPPFPVHACSRISGAILALPTPTHLRFSHPPLNIFLVSPPHHISSFSSPGLSFSVLSHGMSGAHCRVQPSNVLYALRERVVSVLSTGQVEQAQPPAQRVDEVETKAMAPRKALRSVNITGSIGLDEVTGKASVIDVIKMMCPEVDDDYANIALGRVITRDAAESGNPIMGDGTRVALADRVERVQINGKGRTTPSRKRRQNHHRNHVAAPLALRQGFPQAQSAEIIARVLGGDVSLSAEIEQRCARLKSTEEGWAFQSVMLGEAPAKKHKSLPEWFEYATNEQKSAFISAEVKKSVFFTEIEMHHVCKDKMEFVGQFAGRDSIEYAGRIRDAQRRAASDNLLGAPAPGTSVGDQAIVVATAIDNSIDPETGLTIATHKASASVRGPETSICAEAAKLGISTGETNGQIGKVAKRPYGVKHGEVANHNIPTRHTTFRGKPFLERAYLSRDADLVHQATRIVCCPAEVSTS